MNQCISQTAKRSSKNEEARFDPVSHPASYLAVILVIGVFALIRGINFAIAQAIVNLLFRANKQPREESSTPSTTQKEIHNGNE